MQITLATDVCSEGDFNKGEFGAHIPNPI